MMSKLLWLSLPFDFMRVFWIITPFDFVAAIYLIRRLLSGRLNRHVLVIFFACMLPILFIVGVGGIKNYYVADQHLILMIGIFISAIKGFALVDDIARNKKIELSALALGFMAINVISLALLVQGSGVSGAGRAQGVLNQSNAFGLMQVFSFALALSLFSHRKSLSIPLILITLFLTLASGSRGALVSLPLVALVYLAFLLRLDRRGILSFAALMILAVGTLYIDLIEVARLLEELDFAGSVRLASFLHAISAYDATFATEFQDARGGLNGIAFQVFLDNPTLLGVGYGESLSVMTAEARPHNILFSSLLELGALGAFYFSIILICMAYSAVTVSISDRKSIWLLLFIICFNLGAMRTPFYFLAAMPWFLIFVSIYISRHSPSGVPIDVKIA